MKMKKARSSIVRCFARLGLGLLFAAGTALAQQTVNVYSMRARERPTVSMPVSWEEVERGDAAALTFTAHEALERVEAEGDLFGPTLELRQELPSFSA